MIRAGVLALAFLSTGCGVDADATLTPACPSPEGFADVSPVLEARCGTLDCHGALSRPLRVYGATGMRLIDDIAVLEDPASALDAGAYPDGLPTTEAERNGTRRSLCALEPAKLIDVVSGMRDARELMVLQKSVGGERHKGGVVLTVGDDAERCVRAWLEGAPDAAACGAAIP